MVVYEIILGRIKSNHVLFLIVMCLSQVFLVFIFSDDIQLLFIINVFSFIKWELI